MQTSLEHTGKHTVKLTVAVSSDEAKPVLDLAYRHLADQVRVPGFRKGKVPRQIIATQVGEGAVLSEFLEHALPTFYLRALREHELAPIADPDFDELDVSNLEREGFRFSATVDVRPRLEFAEEDYKGIRVERPTAQVTEREVDEQLDRLRERFAELESVGRPAGRGDYVVVDLRATIHDKEIPEASGQGLLYEVGSEELVPKLDKELEGARPGAILRLNVKLPERFGERAGEEVTLTALVKEVKGKKLPALDDEFARTASEFDALDELRGDVRTRLGALKEAEADAEVRNVALRALSEKVDVDLPERLVDQETESRVRAARERAERQGVTLEQVLEASRVDELGFRSDARAHAVRGIKADLALEAIARAEGINVSDRDLDDVVKALAKEVGRPVKEVRRQLESSGQMTALAGDIIRDRALNLVVEHAEVVTGGPQNSEESERKGR